MRQLFALWSACERVLAADRFPRHLWRTCLCLLLAVAAAAAWDAFALHAATARVMPPGRVA